MAASNTVTDALYQLTTLSGVLSVLCVALISLIVTAVHGASLYRYRTLPLYSHRLKDD